MTSKAANTPRRVHLVGIGGAHMSAIAQILHAWGPAAAQPALPATEAGRLGMRTIGHDAATSAMRNSW
jgi:hypothetical protein